MEAAKQMARDAKDLALVAGELNAQATVVLSIVDRASTEALKAWTVVRLMVEELRAGRPIENLDAIDRAAAEAIASIQDLQARHQAQRTAQGKVSG